MKQDGRGFRRTAVVAWLRQFGLLLVLGGVFFALSELSLSAQSSSPSAQSDASFEIRLEAREVVVPVFVANNRFVAVPLRAGSGASNPKDSEIAGLTAENFHVFQDGVEQPVLNVRTEPIHLMNVPDNIGGHPEYSGTPKGMWAGPESWVRGESDWSDKAAHNFGGYRWWYMISYTPPPSAEGSCHQIKVTLNRSDATLYARDEYCDTKHSPSDPLRGTKVDEQMEENAASAQPGKLPLTAQAAATFSSAGAGRVNIAVEFPWRALSTYRNGCYLAANVDLLGLVFTKSGTLAARFSDVAYSPKVWDSRQSKDDICAPANRWLPTRYESQIDLPSGNYNLRIVVTDGEKFGRVEVPLTVDGYDRNDLAVSGIVLCKRFSDMTSAWAWLPNMNPDDLYDRTKFPLGKLSTAPEYVPLLSKGIGLMPAGGTGFRKGDHSHKGERLMSYFEVYEPLLAAGQAKVEFQMRVIDAKTGQLKVGTGSRSAQAYAHSGSSVIPIAQEIAINKLPKGAYRVEVQAVDSAGRQTPWRAASFSVE